MKLSTYRCGMPIVKKPAPFRIGAVRFLPRGVKKKDYARLNYFDVWMPVLAPCAKDVTAYLRSKDRKKAWPAFSKRYIMTVTKDPVAMQAVRLIAGAAQRMPVSLGCYCGDEEFCHRSLLKKIIEAVM